MIENVRGILGAIFEDYRNHVEIQLKELGYEPSWRLVNASDFGVPQLRPRVLFVAIRRDLANGFAWPLPGFVMPPTVGTVLYDLISANGWKGAAQWRDRATHFSDSTPLDSVRYPLLACLLCACFALT